MLREMTSYALAHSCKRFARLAVAGLALAGLAACGGGGSSTPAATAPTTPTPDPACPQGQVRGDDGQCRAEIPITPAPAGRYVSIAYGRDTAERAWAWATGSGTSASAAKSDAEMRCENLLGSRCPVAQDGHTGCTAIALSECSASSCSAPAFEVASGPTKQAAETAAIRSCGSRALPGTSCSIPSSSTGPGVTCGAAVSAGAARQQHPLNEYGSIAFSTNPWGAAAVRSGTSRDAARDAAEDGCENTCTNSSSCGCQEVLWFRNACGSLAKSIDNDRAGVGWGASASAAGENAIAACRDAGGQTCRVSTGKSGRPFTSCYQAGSATPTGQAITIPARPASSPPPAPAPPPAPPPAATTYYGALYFGRVEVSRNNWSYSWSFGSGTSASAAERDAERQCESGFRGNCGRGIGGYANYCGAIAVSACSPGSCSTPAWGYGVDRLRREAEAEAIRDCESRVTVAENRGTCRIATGRERHTRELTPGVLCVGTAAQ